MTYYIPITRLNGRKDFYNLAKLLDERGYGENVEYSEGGYENETKEHITPHLRFLREDDALAYVLAFGGILSTSIPIMETK